SADGRSVAFVRIVDFGRYGVLVTETDSERIDEVSVATDGTSGTGLSLEPRLSADGRVVAFTSTASNLVAGDTNGQSDVFAHDRQTGVTERVDVTSDGRQSSGGQSDSPAVSADGRMVAFASSAINLLP